MLILPLLLGVFLAQPAQSKDFYVSPRGNDSNPGTKALPFASLQHVKSEVRNWNRVNGSEHINVWLYGGEYLLRETLVFSTEDGAKKGQSIRYIAVPGENPVISSDVMLDGWEHVTQPIAGLPASAAGRIWKAKVPHFVKDFKVAYNNGGLLPRAKVGPIAHLRKHHTWMGDESMHNSIPFAKGTTAGLFHPKNAEIVVIPSAPWTLNRLSVGAVDTISDRVYLKGNATYALAAPRFYHDEKAIWIENVFAGLDGPGKWVFDQDSRYFYYWPYHDNQAPKDVVIPSLKEYIRVEGRLGPGVGDDIPVEGIEFIGLTFRHGDRYELVGLSGLGLQHDWELFDAPTAMLRLRGSKRCVVKDCTFYESGGTGVRLDLYAQFNRVVNNNFIDLGGGGVLLAGYGPGKKDVNKYNHISHNTIRNIGTLWWHSIAIWAWQSGHNLIANNTISDLPYTAIAVTGRISWDPNGKGEGSRTVRWDEVAGYVGNEPWEQREQFLHARFNRIEHNDIRNVVTVMSDGNGIYISGAGKQNKVLGNYIHDSLSDHPGEAIRCDDDQHETTIESNVVYRFGTLGTGLCSKGRNYFFNNIVALPPSRVKRGMLSLEPTTKGSCAGSVISNNIFYSTGSNQPLIFMRGMKSEIEDISIDRNIYFSKTDSLEWGQYLSWARSLGKEMNSIHADPLFEDIENGVFRLSPESPAIPLGFKQVGHLPGKIDGIGCTDSELKHPGLLDDRNNLIGF